MTESTHSTPSVTDSRAWLGVVSLGFGVFALVMAEFLPSSLLPSIAHDLGVTEGAAGQSVTFTAVAAGASGLFLPVLFPRAGRKPLLLSLSVLATVSNVIVALAPNLPVLLGARVLVGFAIGGFWSLAIAACVQLVSFAGLGKAMVIINTGMAIATITAVPVGAWLGGLWGWQAVFFLGAVVALCAALFQSFALPAIASAAASGLRALGETLRSGTLLLSLLSFLFIMGGQFAGYTYLVPTVESLADVDAGTIALLLLVFGIANVLGTVSVAALIDRSIRLAAFCYPLLIIAGMITLVLSGHTSAGMYVAVALWGFGFGGVPTTVQTWTARIAPDRLEQIGGLSVVTLQTSIAVGALVGGVLFDVTGPTAPPFVAAGSILIGTLLLSSLRIRGSQQSA